MTARYILAAEAEADLRGMIRYTGKRWGAAQVRSYMTKVTRGIERLASGESRFKDVGEFHPGLRMIRCEHHYIFCLHRDVPPALIVAVLHERMDLVTRLATRFDGL